MKNNDWYKKILLKNTREIVSSATTYVILVLVFLLWHFALGVKFEWQSISPLSEPSIFVRSFYSAFVFCTLGLFLYVIRFYKVLHDILVKALGLWGLYNFVKAIVWTLLMYVSYQYIVPKVFGLLNTSASFLYNIVGIVLYALPPLGITLIITIGFMLFRKNRTNLLYQQYGK